MGAPGFLQRRNGSENVFSPFDGAVIERPERFSAWEGDASHAAAYAEIINGRYPGLPDGFGAQRADVIRWRQ
jgi:hypothetical protein